MFLLRCCKMGNTNNKNGKLQIKGNTNNDDDKKAPENEIKSPEHWIFKQDKDLCINLQKFSATDNEQQREAYEEAAKKAEQEFYALDEFSSNQFFSKKTTDVANANSHYNRYDDIIPYDDNRVILNKEAGDPPSLYINASPIKFPNKAQEFIATQAPLPETLDAFWQMVMQCKVTAIVMITGLVEGGILKANKYWPDEKNPVLNLGNGMTVSYLSHSMPGTYFIREFRVEDGVGPSILVSQLECRKWKDMTVPDQTKVLLDLIYKTQEIAKDRPGQLLVHCSAGVGRTGTYIALYKLIEDFHSDKVDIVDVFETILSMRQQRMSMVHRPRQYHFIFMCLCHYVTNIEDYRNMPTAAGDYIDHLAIHNKENQTKPNQTKTK